MSRRRVGIVGYGSLGQFLVDKILHDARASAELELAFVWNRSADKLRELPEAVQCSDMSSFAAFSADLIVEVCHPRITAEWGARFLEAADFYCGSPTALADAEVERALRATAAGSGHGLYVPAGALWGSSDLSKMADRGSIGALEVCMKKHPGSLKLEGELGAKVDALMARAEALAAGASMRVAAGDGAASAGGDDVLTREHVLFEGSAREISPLAPNNCNTIAAAAVAAHTLGFDGVRAKLVADFRLPAHVITIDARGKPGPDGSAFRCFTERFNPAAPGAVTGTATYASFFSSLLAARGRGAGVHLC